MSGFAGVIRLDDRPTDDETVSRLATAVAHRGADGQGAWQDGPAAFAHAMMRTTPESTNETQPLADRELVVVADVRLDNRDELGRLLGVDGSATDAAFITAAYRKWGRDCATHLEGDFSFAIWNRDDRTLFCARDPFGVKPLVYAFIPGKLFAFGSEVRAVLAHPDVPGEFDESRIADFLAVHFDDDVRTFYAVVKRLPGASTLMLRNGVPEISTYWSVANVKAAPSQSDAQYAEGFREHFTRAVRERMRVRHPSELGAMLSGGLDSSSITCVARDELARTGGPALPVFSWVFSDAMEADEREYQQAVVAQGGVIPHTIDSAVVDSSPWTGVDAFLPDGPLYAGNYYLNSVIATVARGLGVRTVLDGLGGDITISRGGGRFVELFLRGRELSLIRELRAFRDRAGSRQSMLRLFMQHVLSPLAPASLLTAYHALQPRGSDPGLTLLRPRLAAMTGASRSRHRMYVSARQEHRQQLESFLIAEGLELFDRVNAHLGVEGRYPFFDRRLTEYCLSLPADQKMSDGYSRVVVRRALAGVLPDAVRWRAGKGAPGLHSINELRASRAELDLLFLGESPLEPYVDMDVLRRVYGQLQSGQPIQLGAVIRLWSAAILARWLFQASS